MPITGKKPKKSFTAVHNDILTSHLSGYAKHVYTIAISHADDWTFYEDRMRAECSLTRGKRMSRGVLQKALRELREAGLVSGHFGGRRSEQKNRLHSIGNL